MPRKTRKQKVRAQEAWAVRQAQASVVKREFAYDPKNFVRAGSEAGQAKKADKSDSLDGNTLNMPDLVRTIVLALFILSLELVLYWARA
ncbi:MAG: hypothetical protein AAB599_03465 [Patescibacteria group bacterium]